MCREPDAFFRGLATMRQVTGARQVTVAIKHKNADLADRMSRGAQEAGCEFFVYQDVYPAGDEYVLVYEITGRQIPPGGLPLHVGCVVDNVETIVNVGKAIAGTPVTEKYVTITGAVRQPLTDRRARWHVVSGLPACGRWLHGRTIRRCWSAGVMMGGVTRDVTAPVAKTTAGLDRAPSDHYLVRSPRRPRAKPTRGSGTASAISVRFAPSSARVTSWAIRSNRTA